MDWRTKRRIRETIIEVLWHIVIASFGVLMITPLIWLISTSFKAPGQIFLFPPKWIPDPIRWQNYVEAFTLVPFGRYLFNTLWIILWALSGTVLTSSMAAFGFARLRFPGRGFLFMLVLSTLMLPGTVTLIPTFILFTKLGWINTFYPLTVPYWFGGGAFNIFLLRQFFMGIPLDLDEAARIDGAGNWLIYWRILLPLSKPAVATVTVFTFISLWNDFFRPLVYLQDSDKWTMAIGLQIFQGLYATSWHLMMAASTVMIVPIIAIFFMAQQYFVSGIQMTGLAGR
jgi:ABC-type glycerol-3-phosphate transport system permease component